MAAAAASGMTPEKLDALVTRLEVVAQKDPKGYRLRVLSLSALGYAFVLFILAATVGLLGLIVWFIVSSGRLNSGGLKIGPLLGVFAFAGQLEAPKHWIAQKKGRAPDTLHTPIPGGSWASRMKSGFPVGPTRTCIPVGSWQGDPSVW